MGIQRPKTRSRVPENCRIYAIGDIHGRLDLLQRLHKKILEDAAPNPRERQVIVYVGDYVDRGPDSVGVIELLLARPFAGFETHYLKGNHEDFMLRFLDNGANGNVWLMNGGIETLQSYGVYLPWDLGGDLGGYPQAPPPLGPGEMESLRLALKAAVPESHLDFLSHLERHHSEGDYLFVHAGIRPGIPLEKQSERDLIWIREDFLDYEGDFGAIVVHGHSPRSKPDIRDNRIGIDTKAGYGGRLTALVLEGDSRRFLQAD